jgi:hypothetical protein
LNAVVTFPASQITLRATAYEEISVGATVTLLDATKAKQCFRASIKTDGGGNLRYTLDGTTPSGTVGTIFYDGEQLELSQADAIALKMFRAGAVNPVCRVTYVAPIF